MGLNLTAAGLKLGLVEFNATFFFQIVNTFVLFLILKHFLFEPVTNFMEKRKNEIADEIKKAENKHKEAINLKEKYNDKLKQVDSEGKKIIKEARKDAKEQASEIISKAREEEKQIRLDNQKEIEREKIKAIDSLKDEISNLSIMTASKVIEKDLDKSDHQELIDQFIDEVGDVKWQN